MGSRVGTGLVSHRVVGFLWPIPGRRVTAGVMWVLGMGRLGVFSVGSATTVSAWLYGVLLLGLGLALIFTEHEKSLYWYGRFVSALGAGVLMGLGIDVGVKAGLFNTSSVILYWLAIVLFFEAGARREC